MAPGVIPAFATLPVKSRCGVKISHRIKSEQGEPSQEPAHVLLTLVDPTPSNDLHHHRFRHGQSPPRLIDSSSLDLPGSSWLGRTPPMPKCLQDHDKEDRAWSGRFRWRASLAWRVFLRCDRLSGEVAKDEIDGFGLRSQAEAVHDLLQIVILYLDVGSDSAHHLPYASHVRVCTCLRYLLADCRPYRPR